MYCKQQLGSCVPPQWFTEAPKRAQTHTPRFHKKSTDSAMKRWPQNHIFAKVWCSSRDLKSVFIFFITVSQDLCFFRLFEANDPALGSTRSPWREQVSWRALHTCCRESDVSRLEVLGFWRQLGHSCKVWVERFRFARASMNLRCLDCKFGNCNFSWQTIGNGKQPKRCPQICL